MCGEAWRRHEAAGCSPAPFGAATPRGAWCCLMALTRPGDFGPLPVFQHRRTTYGQCVTCPRGADSLLAERPASLLSAALAGGCRFSHLGKAEPAAAQSSCAPGAYMGVPTRPRKESLATCGTLRFVTPPHRHTPACFPFGRSGTSPHEADGEEGRSDFAKEKTWIEISLRYPRGAR